VAEPAPIGQALPARHRFVELRSPQAARRTFFVPTPRELLASAVLAACYVAAGRLALTLDGEDGELFLAWPCAGVAFAALLTISVRLWPGVIAGALVLALSSELPLGAGVAAGAAKALEVLLAALLLRHLRCTSMERIADVCAFLVVCAAATVVGATAGTAALYVGGGIAAPEWGETWRAWWLGDTAGAVVVASLAWSFTAPLRSRAMAGRGLEALGIGMFVVATTLMLFGAVEPEHVEVLQLSNIWFIVVGLAGARFAQRGTTLTTFVIFVIATAGTSLGAGPFGAEALPQGLISLQAFMAILAAAGLVFGAVVAERDAQAEELEAANLTLKAAVKERDTFLSVASHELRTPLGALQLQTELLAHGQEPLPPGVGDRLGRVDRQVRRMKRLVDHLLDVSRIGSGRLELEPERVDLSQLVSDVAARFDEELRRAGCALRLELEGPIWGDWDALRLDQVLSNLVSNAIKYGRGKPVEIDARIVRGAARVSVRDHGIGISPENHGRIFARYERLVSHRQGGGLGLGLWICDQIVTAMGGRIRVMSAPSLGSVFIVELPVRSREATPEKPRSPA
jgi:signal transduction histidine kinase